MTQNADVIFDSERAAGLDAGDYKVGMAGPAIGMLAYLFIVVPVLALLVVVVMNLSNAYGIAVAIALVMTGLYVSEKFTTA